MCFFSLKLHAEQTFNDWLLVLNQDAIASGISIETAEKVCKHIQFLPNIIQLDRAQPEFITPFLEYYHQRVDARKVQIGREKLVQYQTLLNQLEQRYGVSKAYLLAFWGMETNYGKNQGNIDILSSLATLGFEGRRAEFFRQQLIDAMRIVDETNIPIEQWQGSWAGAFGQMQFMPSTFMTFAVDGDNDTQIDLIQSEYDAITSAANYLSQVGWQFEQPAMVEVQLPGKFEMQQAQLNQKKSIGEWMKLGVVALQGEKETRHQYPPLLKSKSKKLKSKLHVTKNHQAVDFSESYIAVSTISLNKVIHDMDQQAAILLPQGWSGPAFMVLSNFESIMDWNKSVNYALSIVKLAQQINGQPPVLGGLKAESGALSFSQMQQLQAILNALGFDAGEPDGLPGLQTQSAIRAYQIEHGLPADGYASPSLFHVLNQQMLEHNS